MQTQQIKTDIQGNASENSLKLNSESISKQENNMVFRQFEDETEHNNQKLKREIELANLLIIEQQYNKSYNVLYSYLKNEHEKESESNEETFKLTLKGYYLFGLSCIHMNKIKKAEDILMSAYWKSLKNKEKTQDQQSQQQVDELTITRLKSFALLFEHQKKYQKTMQMYSQCLYILSMNYGPTHIKCLILYYKLGRLNIKMKSPFNVSVNFLQKFTEIWFEIVLKSLTQGMVLVSFMAFRDEFYLDFKENLIALDFLHKAIFSDDTTEYQLNDQIKQHFKSNIMFKSQLSLVLMVFRSVLKKYEEKIEGKPCEYIKAMISFNSTLRSLPDNQLSLILKNINANMFD
jgi:tetratricopeptide (TPR) repeat protein